MSNSLLVPGGLLDALGGDPKNLLVGGHSYGGPAAILAAAAQPNLFSGLILHDPALGSSMPRVSQPVFSVVGDQYAGITNLVSEVRKVASVPAGTTPQGRPWAGSWHYEGISHGNFVDAPLWAPLVIMRLLGLLLIPAAGPAEPAEAHRQLAEAAAEFAYGSLDSSRLQASGATEPGPSWRRL